MSPQTVFDFRFEWDATKAATNRRKHGVTFQQAATVFRDRFAVSIRDEVDSESEARWVTVGQADNGALAVVIHTYHETGLGAMNVRIISARRATRSERRDYETGR